MAAKLRGSKVIYVASSARDFPESVQNWLSQADNRAASSPHLYDFLATLATGARPQAVIISIDTLDWNELEFFDHVARLSPRTRVYVVGHDHQHEKLDAACQRGAVPFDEEMLAEDLSGPAMVVPQSGPSGLVAGAVQPKLAPRPAPAVAKPTLVPAPAPEPIDAPEPINVSRPVMSPQVVAPPPPAPVAPATPKPIEAAPVALSLPDVTPAARVPVPAVEDVPAPAAASAPAPQPAPRVPVRLVTSDEEDEGDRDRKPVPFPWAPSRDRPTRTPPSPVVGRHAPPPAELKKAEPAPVIRTSEPKPAPPPKPAEPVVLAPRPAEPPARPKQIELTAEELAALIGKPIGSQDRTRERRG